MIAQCSNGWVESLSGEGNDALTKQGVGHNVHKDTDTPGTGVAVTRRLPTTLGTDPRNPAPSWHVLLFLRRWL